jgi:hypothetical protein
MNGRALQQRLAEIKVEIAAIQASEARYKLSTTHSPIARAAHDARRTALEAIKTELASLLPPKVQ